MYKCSKKAIGRLSQWPFLVCCHLHQKRFLEWLDGQLGGQLGGHYHGDNYNQIVHVGWTVGWTFHRLFVGY